MRADRPSISAPPFPRNLPWVNVAMLRMDQQRGQGRPGRVLGLLPRQLAAHAALPEGLARALRRRRACGSSACTPAGSSRRATRRTSAAPSSGWRSPGRSRSTPTSRCGTSTATRAGPRATCGTRDRTLHSLHYGEGAYVETELEIQALLGVERDPVAPMRPEDAAGRADRAADRGPAGRLLRALRGGRRVGGRRGLRRGARQRARAARHRAGLLRRCSSTRATRRAS